MGKGRKGARRCRFAGREVTGRRVEGCGMQRGREERGEERRESRAEQREDTVNGV